MSRSLPDRARALGAAVTLIALAAVSLIVSGTPQTTPTADAATAPAPAAAPAGFAYRCGIRFCLDGRTYFFAGANTYDLFTYGSGSGDTETQYMDKARIDSQFARLSRDGVTVLRTWLFNHESWHGFETSEGVYEEQQFALFDYVVESARKHGVKIIPVFENYWEAYGGIDTRLRWEGLSGGHPARGQFFDRTKCPGCFEQYKNYVFYILNRVNHYSGVAYKDDPTIFAWELMNEPRYQDQTPNENSTGHTLRAWIDEMAGFVKSIDPHHMVGTGLEAHEARYGFGGDEGNPFVYIHQSPHIDFTSAHPYPTEHWADLDIEEMKALMREWVHDSHQVVGKPFYMGEFNVHNVDRTLWWRELYEEFERIGGDGSGFWWYQDRGIDGKFGVSEGAPELAVFKAHSQRQAAKNGTQPTTTTSRTTTTNPTTTTTTTTTTTRPSAGCHVSYRVVYQWQGGFQADVVIRNTGSTPLNGWTLRWSYTDGQVITQAWHATHTQNGSQVTARNENWKPTVPAGGTTDFGLNARSGATNTSPTGFTLNDTPCTTG